MTDNPFPADRDTATGTDPEAKYDRAGYEDKSLGQAVNQDVDTVEALVAASDGDLDAAEARFQTESAGAPALARRAEAAAGDAAAPGTPGEHRTGVEQAKENRENDPPA